MNFEIIWNDRNWYINDVGNEIQGCLNVLKQFAEENPNLDIPVEPFKVINLTNSTDNTIGLADVLAVGRLSSEYTGINEPEPELDPLCDLMMEAMFA